MTVLLLLFYIEAKRRAVSCEACSQCTGNVQCEHNAEGKTSRCLQGYVIRNGTCLKGESDDTISNRNSTLSVLPWCESNDPSVFTPMNFYTE